MSEIRTQELEPCKINVYYVADDEEINQKREQVLQAFKDAPVPGFRKGKQTTEVIRIHYKNQIKEAMKRALTESAFHNTLFEKNYRPYGEPYISTMFFERGEFNCEFIIHIKPDFELAAYKGIDVPRPAIKETTEQISAEMIQQLRIKFGDTLPYSETDFVQTNDQIILDFVGSVAGQNVPALSKEGALMTVGSTTLPGFDDMLLGMKQNEEKSFSITATKDSLPSLAGKLIDFKAKLITGTKTIPCALDDQLAIKVGKTTILELQEEVNRAATGKYMQIAKQSLTDAVQNRLVADNNITVPTFMSKGEAEFLVSKANLKWAELDPVDQEAYTKVAEKNVKLALILDRIAEDCPEAQLSDQEVFSILKDHLARNYKTNNVEETIKEMNKNG